MSDIPGYYYDSEKGRYFKIEKHGTPGFVTQSYVNSLHAATEVQKVIEKINVNTKYVKVANKRSQIINFISEREISTSVSAEFSFCVPQSEIRNFKQKQIKSVSHSKILLPSPNGNLLHATDSHRVMTYNLFWRISNQNKHIDDVQEAKTVGFRILAQNIAYPIDLENRTCIDIRWCVPGHQFDLLSMDASDSSLSTIHYSGDSYDICHSQLFPFNISQAQFVAPLILADQDCNIAHEFHSSSLSVDCKLKSVLIRTRNKLFLSDYTDFSAITPFNLRNPRTPQSSFSRLSYTACCEASLWNSCDIKQKTIESVAGRQPLIYVAGTQSDQGFLYLTRPSLNSRNSVQLIKFNTGYWTNIGRRDSNNPQLEITSLQCIGSSYGDRLGLLVGRRSGLLQLWDDRFPNSPAIEYPGSDGSAVFSVASHIPPKPVIDPVGKRTVACPLLSSPYVGVWDLRTGQVLNVCQFGEYPARPASSKPPLVIYRTQWNNMRQVPCRGAALLVFDENRMHSFY